MIYRRFHHLLYLLIFVGVCLIVFLQMRVNIAINSTSSERSALKSERKILFWWTQRQPTQEIVCGRHVCLRTADPKYYHAANAFLFYASVIQKQKMPVPREPHHLWALLHEESPQNVLYIKFKSVLQHFNLTSTFSRYSDYPLTTVHLPNQSILTSWEYVVPLEKKNELRDVLAPVVFLHSDCNVMTDRDDYTKELLNYIPIDTYGPCLPTQRELPVELQGRYISTLYAPGTLRFFAKYKFIMAFENGVCHDYITEKFWRPLIVGAIPIYFGAPNIHDWEPNFNSAIYVRDFETPKQLADYILYLDRNDTAYRDYQQHKYNMKKPISNTHLVRELEQRHFPYPSLNFWLAFECAVCTSIHEMSPSEKRQAGESHYSCPITLMAPKRPEASVPVRYYQTVYHYAELEARALDAMWQQNKNFTSMESMLKSEAITP